MCVVIFEFCEFCMELCPEVAHTDPCWMIKRQSLDPKDCPTIIYKVKDIVCAWCLDHVWDFTFWRPQQSNILVYRHLRTLPVGFYALHSIRSETSCYGTIWFNLGSQKPFDLPLQTTSTFLWAIVWQFTRLSSSWPSIVWQFTQLSRSCTAGIMVYACICMYCMCMFAFSPFCWVCATDHIDRACLKKINVRISNNRQGLVEIIKKQPKSANCSVHKVRL